MEIIISTKQRKMVCLRIFLMWIFIIFTLGFVVGCGQENNIGNKENNHRKKKSVGLETKKKKSTKSNQTAHLIKAVKKGKLKKVKKLIDSGVSPNVKSKSGKPVLYIAVEKEYFQIAKYLINKGAKVNAIYPAPKFEVTPLHIAVSNQNRRLVKLLLNNGANPNVNPEKGGPPLHIAAYKGNAEIVKLLIENGADVNASTKDGTPIRAAKSGDNSKIVKILKKHGAKNY